MATTPPDRKQQDDADAAYRPWFLLGLDLGQAADYTALCVVERTFRPDPADATRKVSDYGVRHLHRWKLGTPYTTIVADLAALARRPPLPGSPLVVDGTGVGAPVVEMIRRARLPLATRPVIITAGHEVGVGDDGSDHVPKKDLVGTMQTLVQFRRFHIAPSLPDAVTLGRELQQFRVKVSALTGQESFEAWRERDHDDLVLAVALACWYGEHHQPFLRPALIDNPPPWNPLGGPAAFEARHGPGGSPGRRLLDRVGQRRP